MRNASGCPSLFVRPLGRTPPLPAVMVLLAAMATVSNASPPLAQSTSASAFTAFPANIPLRATDDGQPNPPGMLSYVIMSLPSHGLLTHLNAGRPVISTPYTLPNGGMWVTYTSATGYSGPDSFTFVANDGGVGSDGEGSTCDRAK
jgi:hypothetical protein